jgi:hypothetical protein
MKSNDLRIGNSNIYVIGYNVTQLGEPWMCAYFRQIAVIVW